MVEKKLSKMPLIVGIVGKSDSGKTTFLEKLIPILKNRGFKIGVIKHSTCEIMIDHKGKDTWRHKNAGADCVAALSFQNFVFFKDYNNEESLHEIVKKHFNDMDIILTEGFKKEKIQKIEILRDNSSPFCAHDSSLIAFVSNFDLKSNVPCFKFHDIEKIADLIESLYNETRTN